MNASQQLGCQFCKVVPINPLKQPKTTIYTLYIQFFLYNLINYSYFLLSGNLINMPIKNQKIIANFEASKRSINKAFTKSPGKHPNKPPINTKFSFEYLSKGKFFKN